MRESVAEPALAHLLDHVVVGHAAMGRELDALAGGAIDEGEPAGTTAGHVDLGVFLELKRPYSSAIEIDEREVCRIAVYRHVVLVMPPSHERERGVRQGAPPG